MQKGLETLEEAREIRTLTILAFGLQRRRKVYTFLDPSVSEGAWRSWTYCEPRQRNWQPGHFRWRSVVESLDLQTCFFMLFFNAFCMNHATMIHYACLLFHCLNMFKLYNFCSTDPCIHKGFVYFGGKYDIFIFLNYIILILLLVCKNTMSTILHLDGNAVVRVSCCIGGNIAALLVGSLGNFMVPASENSVITQKRWMRWGDTWWREKRIRRHFAASV